MDKVVTLVHSPTGHYVEFYADFDEDMTDEDIADEILMDCYVEVRNA